MVYFVLFSLVFVFTEPRSKIPTLSERVALHPRPFTRSVEGLVSLQFTLLVFLPTDHCPLITPTISLSPFPATFMDPSASVGNKRLTDGLKPLDTTLTKNRGGPPFAVPGIPSNSHSGTHPLLPIPAKA